MVAIEGLGRLLAEHPFFHDMQPDIRDIVVGSGLFSSAP